MGSQGRVSGRRQRLYEALGIDVSASAREVHVAFKRRAPPTSGWLRGGLSRAAVEAFHGPPPTRPLRPRGLAAEAPEAAPRRKRRRSRLRASRGRRLVRPRRRTPRRRARALTGGPALDRVCRCWRDCPQGRALAEVLSLSQRGALAREPQDAGSGAPRGVVACPSSTLGRAPNKN